MNRRAPQETGKNTHSKIKRGRGDECPKARPDSGEVETHFSLPSILLSGFMFPFRGMPHWEQYIGEVLPLTHFLRIVRGILLKGNGLPDVARDLWPIALFAAVMLTIGIKGYRQTLD